MAILTNEDIIDLMRQGKLIHGGSEEHVSPCSYDLGIGTIFRDGQVINAQHSKAGEQIIIAPGEVVTMLTLEQVDLPPNIAATAYAMNEQSSEGLLVLNPGHVDPGFRGALTVKAVNLRKVALALSLKERIFTVVFDQLEKDARPAYINKGSHGARELAINKKDVEKSMKSFSQLIALNAPFPTHKEVSGIIAKHWMSWVTFFLTLGAFFAAVVAATFGVIAVFQNSNLALTQSPRQERPEIMRDPADLKKEKDAKSQKIGATQEKKTAAKHEPTERKATSGSGAKSQSREQAEKK